MGSPGSHPVSSSCTLTMDCRAILLCLGLAILACSVSADCAWKEKKIRVGEGEAVKFAKKRGKVKLCLDGGLQYKFIKDVEFTVPCNGCVWYDDVLCDGETVEDLYRWWFLSRCSNKRLSVISRSWSDVRSDPRYKP